MHWLLLLVIAVFALQTWTYADTLQTDKDSESNLSIHYVTNTPSINTTAYPTCRTWSADGRYLFVESSRARPDGTKKTGERQLLKTDIATCETTHLATLDVEDTVPYGKAHIRCSTEYHFDYAHEANLMVYYDMTGHNLYLMDLSTGKSERILHEHEGTIGDPPAITSDGKRIVYYVRYPSIANRFLSDVTSVIFYLDVDPKTLKPVKDPKVVTAYPGRMDPASKDKMPQGVIVDHCQVNPKNPDHFIYAHEFNIVRPDDSDPVYYRVWENKNGVDRFLDKPDPGLHPTHEVIGSSGKNIYYVDCSGVSVIDLDSGKRRLAYGNKEGLNPCHVAVSPDEKWLTVDMWDSNTPDENGCFRSGIALIEAATGKSKVLCRIKRGKGHPRHPHPNFSPDGTKIAFTIADDKNTSQVAYVDISEVIRNWSK